MSENCIFCKIINGEIPSKVIYEDDYFKAILDVNPATPGHTIIISKVCAEDLYALPDEYAGRLTPFVKKIAIMINKAMANESVVGMNILQNNGEAAGQTVFHYHTHVIPRYEGDKVTVGWEGPGSTNVELDSICAKITGKS